MTSEHYYFVEKLKIVEKKLFKLNCSYGKVSHALKQTFFWVFIQHNHSIAASFFLFSFFFFFCTRTIECIVDSRFVFQETECVNVFKRECEGCRLCELWAFWWGRSLCVDRTFWPATFIILIVRPLYQHLDISRQQRLTNREFSQGVWEWEGNKCAFINE